MYSLLSFAALVAAAAANTGILLPLYEYPSGDAGIADWNAAIAAAAAHPDVPFYVIINDNNGPPYSPNPPTEITDFAPFLGAFNALSNAKLIGYIATSYGGKSDSDVETAVDQYAAWTTAAGSNSTTYDIHIDGIFFDEINTVTSQLTHNTAITQYAKSKFTGPVVLNPGTFVESGSESLFDVADAILDIEACYTHSTGRLDYGGYACDNSSSDYVAFTPALLDQIGTNLTHLNKSAVVVHDFYETWLPYQAASKCTLQTDIKAIVAKGLHSLYFAQLGYNSNFTGAEPASITTVTQLLASALGVA
ncbi:spherulin 4-like cell surface [Hypoxylon sp. FL1150]|nr:spherulin 4-like cell surface [Hypoxylon sp. FL1150]